MNTKRQHSIELHCQLLSLGRELTFREMVHIHTCDKCRVGTASYPCSEILVIKQLKQKVFDILTDNSPKKGGGYTN